MGLREKVKDFFIEPTVKEKADRAAYKAELEKQEAATRKKWASEKAKKKLERDYGLDKKKSGKKRRRVKKRRPQKTKKRRKQRSVRKDVNSYINEMSRLI